MSSTVNAGTGAIFYTLYGWEATFNTPVAQASRNKVFGRQVHVTPFQVQANYDKLFELYQRQASVARYKEFAGSFSVDAVMSNPWWLKGLLGAVADAGTGPYTHTFTYTKSLPSMTIEAGFALPSGNVVRTLSGAVIKQASLSGAVNDWIKAKIDFHFSQEQAVSSTLNTNPYVDTFVPFTYADAVLQMPTGTTIAEVQNFDITINNNVTPVYGLGSNYATEVLPQQLDLETKVTATFKNATLLNDFLNATQVASASLILTGTDGSSINFAFGTTYVQDHGITGTEPNSLVQEDITLSHLNLTNVVATNTTATTP